MYRTKRYVCEIVAAVVGSGGRVVYRRVGRETRTTGSS